MDERAELYENIVEEYLKCRSVLKVADRLNTNTIKVRRVLITEGLWESETSKKIGDLYHEGKKVSEIAEMLCMSEKNVQSYLPYSRGAYGGVKSKDAERSEEYRERMQRASKNQVSVQKVGKDLSKIPQRSSKKPEHITRISETKNSFERLPSILKLKFELVSSYYPHSSVGRYDMKPREEREFLELAKAEEGVVRETLVPAEMNLHALHYMIQKLFGWQNSHLHRFSLSKKDFDMVTDGQKMKQYMNLCGSIFMFPDDDMDDRFWDDDYKEGESFKSWLRRKYVDNFKDFGAENTYVRNVERVKDFTKHHKYLLSDSNVTIKEIEEAIIFEEDPNTLIEKLKVRNLFQTAYKDRFNPKDASWRSFQELLMRSTVEEVEAEWKSNRKEYKMVLDGLQELINMRSVLGSVDRAIYEDQLDTVRNFYGEEPHEIIKTIEADIADLEQMLNPILTNSNPGVVPVAEELYYLYDYGDSWCVRITCTGSYTANCDSDDRSVRSEKSTVDPGRTVSASELEFVDWNGKIVRDIREMLRTVYLDKAPICVMADGLNVMDDVGGLHGFYDFLKLMNSNDPEDEEEKAEYRSWARMMGWTGRKSSPKNML
ncbi:MAG: hypothetical protein IK020_02190 [Clostridiales bacterium]|nr:hypothetical protein [Clostridiales bacterium]